MDQSLLESQTTIKTQVKTPSELTRLKYSVCVFVLCICSPITICDLYFAFTGNHCLTDYPDKLKINMSQYLVVAGVGNLYNLAVAIFYFQLLHSSNSIVKNIFYFTICMSGILIHIWNIIGAYIFWSFVYNCKDCPSIIFNYLFAILSIRCLCAIGFVCFVCCVSFSDTLHLKE